MDTKISLKDFAARQNQSYSTTYRNYKAGKIPNTEIVKGDIFVNVSDATPSSTKSPAKSLISNTVLSTASTYSDGSRSGKNHSNTLICPYKNIDSLFAPVGAIITAGQASNNSCLDPQDTIRLAQKAYYGLSSVRRVIDTLKDFSASKVYLQDGSAKSRAFFYNYFKYIGLNSFTEKFFLEFWRSSNCFVYKLKGKVSGKNLLSLKKTVGASSLASAAILPVQYVILNPVDIIFKGAAFFSYGKYYKTLSPYEISQLQKRETLQDEMIFNALPKDVQAKLNSTKTSNVGNLLIELPPDSVKAIFNGKQDYEGFAVSLIYPVLDDLEYKLELKQMDRAIAKTCQQSVLHVALGYENKNGEYFFSEDAAKKIEEVFSEGSAGKVLITDFTAKLQFALPQIGELLDPKKYEVVNRDIQDGLMDILSGGESGEKFANLTVKVKVFIERIRKAREIFLNEFLVPEMEAIAAEIGLKQIPTPKFEDIDIEDNLNFYRVITRLAEIGLLTPTEVFDAFETGRFPTGEESLESQKEYKKQRDQELYNPLIGGAKPTEDKGRPATPATTKKKVTPQGMKGEAKHTLNAEKMVDILKTELQFKESLIPIFKKTHKIKSLNAEQVEFINCLANTIILNEPLNNWSNSVDKYLNSEEKTEQYAKIESLSQELHMSLNSAALVYHANQ